MIRAPYGIVGDGNLARHMIRYFQYLDLPFRQWKRKSEQDIYESLQDCGSILLLIKDSEIHSFYKGHRFLQDKLCLHFSGSLSLPEIPSAHPLMSFSNELYSFEQYKQIHFVIEQGRDSFSELLPGLENSFSEIKSEQKPLYHALCVCMGNFSQMLWREVEEEFLQLKIPRMAFQMYLRQILENYFNDNSALTGPHRRGDLKSIEKNLEALNGKNLEPIYKSFDRLFQTQRKLYETHS